MAKKQRGAGGLQRATWVAVYEHPEFGTVKVWWRWERTLGREKGLYKVVPGAVEFDLFTPPEVQRQMLDDLERVRVYQINDVTGSGPLPWES